MSSSSFDQLSSLESGRGGGRSDQPYSDDPVFRTLHQDLVGRLHALRSNISKLSTDVNLLGTKRDTARVRERTHDLLEKSTVMCKEIGQGVKRLQTWQDLSKQQKYEQTRVSTEFQTALQEFQDLQRKALDRERASVTAARAAQDTEQGPGGSTDRLIDESSQAGQEQQQQQQQQERLANQDEVDFQESLIIQREEEIRAIEQGVGDLNVLFRQVAQIVNEQGDQLGTIADQVENVRDDTHAAERENRQAARYQKAARNKSCGLLLIMAVILLIVMLAIFLG